MTKRPYSRSEYNRALVANALLTPFNVVLLALMLIAGIVLGLPFALIAPLALVIYGAGAVRTYFDEDAANKVLERERGKRKPLGPAPAKLESFAPQIGELVRQARARKERLDASIRAADAPFEEVSGEVDAFVTAIEGTAKRAQLLWDALSDTPPAGVEQRLAQVRAANDPSYKELAAALEAQLATLRRMEDQLRRFFAEIERMLVELDTIRGQIVSVSASEEAGRQREIAADVRALREQVGAVADGMAEAYGPAQ